MGISKDINIVVVDDHKTMTKIIRGLLGQLGFNNVEEYNEAATAFEKLKSKKYDLIISDWNMEPVSGLQFLKMVRAEESLKTIPFIMVTAESKKENVLAAKEAGVSNYIVKPFNSETLKEKLVSVLGPF
ncbi:MAG: two-component system response regulator [Rickettsiaceae bacterium]|jgi:two-component system chemotaxis response regulator CheY|nr:two-component system response regulator [Rickettsiaceae bacterium]